MVMHTRTQRCAYGATARARRGTFTLSGGEARACANELEDEFEERCGSQKMKSRLMDGGRQMDMALKDAGRRAPERVAENGPVPMYLEKQKRQVEQKTQRPRAGTACAAKNERRRGTKPRSSAQFIRRT